MEFTDFLFDSLSFIYIAQREVIGVSKDSLLSSGQGHYNWEEKHRAARTLPQECAALLFLPQMVVIWDSREYHSPMLGI
jgi:hypothetical protein